MTGPKPLSPPPSAPAALPPFTAEMRERLENAAAKRWYAEIDPDDLRPLLAAHDALLADAPTPSLTLTSIADEEEGSETGLLIDLPNRTQIWVSETSKATFKDQGEDACAMLGGNDYGLFLHRGLNDGTGTQILARVADLEAGKELAMALALFGIRQPGDGGQSR